MNRVYSILLFVFCSFIGFAQKGELADAAKNKVIEQRIELIAEALGAENIDFTTLFDELSYRYDHPLNLNKASYEELEQLNLLNDLQIKGLLEHIRLAGALTEIYEIQAIADWDINTINAVLPFVAVTDQFKLNAFSWSQVKKEGSHEVLMRSTTVLEKQAGYLDYSDSALAASPNKAYLGSPYQTYFRYRFRYGNRISMGVTADKDQGEPFGKPYNKAGFDFYSAHLYVAGFGVVKKLVVGDFQAQFGQGLTCWSGLAARKSSLATAISRSGTGLRPYTSVDENLFLRGVGTTLQWKQFDFTAFYSRHAVDANIALAQDSIGSEASATFTSLVSSGLHRTPGELADKKTLMENSYGGNLSYHSRSLQIGVTAIGRAFDASYSPNVTPYNQFFVVPQNDQYLNLGADYKWLYRNMNFFGEVSRSLNGGTAMIHGLLMSIDPKIDVAIQYRNFGKDYQGFLANPFAESGSSTEKATYLGVVARPFSKWTVSGYFDKYKFDWLKFSTSAPSDGVDALLQVDYKPSKKVLIYARYFQQVKAKNVSGSEEVFKTMVDQNRQQLRIHLSYGASDVLSFQSRVQYSWFDEPGKPQEIGFLAYQDVSFDWKIKRVKFSLDARFMLFDIDSYDARLYAYERDLLYLFSVPAFQNRGTRAYLVLRFKPIRHLDVQFKIARTTYSNVNTIGSGTTLIDGNHKTDAKLQLRWSF